MMDDEIVILTTRVLLSTFVLVTEPELCDELSIALYFCPLHVIEEPATPANHLQQPAAAVMILLVRLEVLVEVVDPVREDGYLDAR
jgi:hypothetical protein